MVKKITSIFIVITILFAMTITINAQFLVTTFNPPNIIGGEMQTVNSTNAVYNLKIYPFDYNGDKLFGTGRTSPTLIIGLWHSIILPDTVYKYSIKLDMHKTETGNTGSLQESNIQFISIASQNKFSQLNSSNVGVIQGIQGQPVTPLPSDYYSFFWDKTSGMLSVVFCIPQSYYTEHISEFTHCYLITAIGNASGASITNNVELQEYTGVKIQGAYSQVLDEISQKLESLSSGADGVTEEQINQAVQDALTAHDLQLEQEVDGKLDQIMEQINGIVSPYKDAADEINNAFDGLSAVFVSSSTASVFKFPEGRMPNGVVLWQEQNIDIGAAWNKLPAKFRSVVQIVCTFTILYIVIQEAIFVIRFIILGRKGSADD